MQYTDSKEGVREKLILTAIALYAEKGLGGVSLREIGTASGAKNSGVMQYYFGSKLGLLEAVMEMVAQRLLLLQQQSPPEQAQDVTVLVSRVIQSMTALIHSCEWGEDAVKVMSLMLLETNNDIRDIINSYFSEQTVQLFERVCCFYPLVEPNKIKLRVLVALDCIIHSLSEWKSLRNSPAGELSFYNEVELAEELSDFVVGGIIYKL